MLAKSHGVDFNHQQGLAEKCCRGKSEEDRGTRPEEFPPSQSLSLTMGSSPGSGEGQPGTGQSRSLAFLGRGSVTEDVIASHRSPLTNMGRQAVDGQAPLGRGNVQRRW